MTGPKAEKGEDRRSNRTRQNNKGADRKMESNDSPEIPDRGGDIRRARPPFGPTNEVTNQLTNYQQNHISFEVSNQQANQPKGKGALKRKKEKYTPVHWNVLREHTFCRTVINHI